MEVPTLSQSASKMRQVTPPDLPDAQEQSVVDQDTAPGPEPDWIEADVAFLVYRSPSGETVPSTDLNIPLRVKRPATTHEMEGMALNVATMVGAMMVSPGLAETTVDRLFEKQREMVMAAQEAQLRQHIEQEMQNARKQEAGR